MATKSEAKKDWDKSNTTTITCCIMNKSGIPQAMQDFLDFHVGMTKSAFCAKAIAQFLKSEGFDPEDYKPNN